MRGLVKAFGDKQVLRGLDLDVAAGAVPRHRRPQRLRQEHAAAADRRARRARRRARSTSASARRRRVVRARDVPGAAAAALGERLANVEVGLGARRREPDARRRALDALAAVGLADRAGDWPSALSGGQKQRVALARALVSRPRFLALDEPLGALDALTRIEMQSLLEAAWRREGFTALLVTHDVAEAVTLADRIVLIEDGAVALDLDVDLPRPRLRGSPAFGAAGRDDPRPPARPVAKRLGRRNVGPQPGEASPPSSPDALGAPDAPRPRQIGATDALPTRAAPNPGSGLSFLKH